jgi:AmiR/NasT family two-component response regulator
LEYGDMNRLKDETQSDRVAQASGMVSVQAACSVDEAFAMIEARAQTIDLTAEQVADSVVDRQFRFSIRS